MGKLTPYQMKLQLKGCCTKCDDNVDSASAASCTEGCYKNFGGSSFGKAPTGIGAVAVNMFWPPYVNKNPGGYETMDPGDVIA